MIGRMWALIAIALVSTSIAHAQQTIDPDPLDTFQDVQLSCSITPKVTYRTGNAPLTPKTAILELKRYIDGQALWLGFRVVALEEDGSQNTPRGTRSGPTMIQFIASQCRIAPCKADLFDATIVFAGIDQEGAIDPPIMQINRFSGAYYAGYKTDEFVYHEEGTCEKTQPGRRF